MIHQQTTLARECSIEGIGLHTGAKVRMDFKPAPANHGIVFRRIDQDPPVDIPATIDHVPMSSAVPRNTTLEKDGVRIHTVEHVLSALHGLGIHNVLIELNGGEPVEPVDGSCLPFVEALKEAGLTKQGDLRKVFEIRKAIQWSDDNGVEIMAVPYDGFRVSFTIRYDNKLIGTQYLSLEISPESFEKDIAPARTFALISDVRQLQESGFIRGGTLENAVVVEDDRIINDTPLRYPDEFVRHKILDLVGDLTLLGQSIRGHIMAVRSGHQANTSFVKKMAQQAQKERSVRDEKGLWGIMDILEIMPHRYPFLLLDRVIEFEDRKRVVAIKNVTINEPFFAGHFPGHPVMPAVLIIEAMAQAGGVLLMNSVGDPSNKLMYFAGVDKARFRKPVRPGDQLRFEVELLRFGGAMCKVQGKAYVEEDLVAEAIILCSIIER